MASSAATLYTPDILAAAAGLAVFPWDATLPFQGQARSRSCGSTIALAVSLDDEGRIARIGLLPHACAVGQAAAFAFASAALGRTKAEVTSARTALAAWLADEAGMPEWPGLELIAPARAYPGRHGAIVLAWDAALDALS